jgi:hypothetical protein
MTVCVLLCLCFYCVPVIVEKTLRMCTKGNHKDSYFILYYSKFLRANIVTITAESYTVLNLRTTLCRIAEVQ